MWLSFECCEYVVVLWGREDVILSHVVGGFHLLIWKEHLLSFVVVVERNSPTHILR